MPNYYEVLGIDKDASQAQVKRAYHGLSLKHHPDRHSGATEAVKAQQTEIFKQVSEAYEVLSDQDQRARYDSAQRANVSDTDFQQAQNRRQTDAFQREATQAQASPQSSYAQHNAPRYTPRQWSYAQPSQHSARRQSPFFAQHRVPVSQNYGQSDFLMLMIAIRMVQMQHAMRTAYLMNAFNMKFYSAFQAPAQNEQTSYRSFTFCR